MKTKGIPTTAYAALGDEHSCNVRLSFKRAREASESGLADTTALTQRYPYLTVGVSNLKTSSRKALRWYGGTLGDLFPAVMPSGSVSAEPPQPEPEAGDSEDTSGAQAGAENIVTGSLRPLYPSYAYFYDPAGHIHRVLHVYRRNPVISVTVGVSDVAAMQAWFQQVTGAEVLHGRPGTGPVPRLGVLSELYLPAVEGAVEAFEVREGVRSALAYGHPAASTCLVLEKMGLTTSLCPSPSKEQKIEVPSQAMLCIQLPSSQLLSAYSSVTESSVWVDAEPLGHAHTGSQGKEQAVRQHGFLAEDVDGNVFKFEPAGVLL